jgi:hypothetical protein
MKFDFSTPGKVSISMRDYVEDALSEYEVTEHAVNPATVQLFDVTPDLPPLPKSQSVMYHSRVAKLAYLARRVRPDILTAISFLSTRVQCATAEDWKKLNRVLKYLNATRDMHIVLEAETPIAVSVEIDASYAVHRDCKSHSGTVISFGLGCGPVYVSSKKQKLNAKSSTEAELIAVSDGIGQGLWCRQFLIGQGYDIGPVKLFQDNTSTIHLLHKSHGDSQRSRHINIRFFFVKDLIDRGEVVVEHLGTDSMRADHLTKALVGEKFREMSKSLMCF